MNIEAAAQAELRALRKARQTETEARAEIARRVRNLRALGASWAFIGAGLGITRAAACKRFKDTERTTR